MELTSIGEFMKKITLALIFASTPAFASLDFACAGENSSETMEFSIDDSEGLQINRVSSALCGNHTQIEEGDEAVWLSINEPTPAARTIKYDMSNSSWGYTLTIPRKVSEGEAEGAFKASYRFDYNDQDKLTLERQLTCKEVE